MPLCALRTYIASPVAPKKSNSSDTDRRVEKGGHARCLWHAYFKKAPKKAQAELERHASPCSAAGPVSIRDVLDALVHGRKLPITDLSLQKTSGDRRLNKPMLFV